MTTTMVTVAAMAATEAAVVMVEDMGGINNGNVAAHDLIR